jgi:large subunit ribosomal protein L20
MLATKKRRRRVLEQTRGYFGKKSKLFRYAKDALWRAGQFAYRDRKRRKTDFRQLWIVRINAVCRENGMPYHMFMNGLKKAGVELNRKSLSELAIGDSAVFKALVGRARLALGAAAT